MSESYNDYLNSQNFKPPQLERDFSLTQKVGAGAVLGAQESMLLTGAHAVSNLYEGYKAKQNGEEPITKDQLTELSPDMEYREGEYMSQAIRRHKYLKQREVASIVSSQMSMAGQFGSGLLGSLVDTPAMLIPGGAAISAAKAGERAFRTGTSFRKAKQIVDAANNTPTLRKAFLGATAEQALETNLVLKASEYTGREYGSTDAVFDMVFGVGLATGMNIPLVAKANSIARQQGRMVADAHAMESFFTSGEYTEGATLLRKYSEDLDLGIKTNPEVEAAFNTPKDQRTPESEALVQDFIEQHIEDIATARVKAEVQVDPDKPISEARAEAEEATQAGVDAVRRKVNGEPEPVKELSPRAVRKEFDRLIKELQPVIKPTGQSVKDSRVESKEEVLIRGAQRRIAEEKTKKRKDRDTAEIKRLEESIQEYKAAFVKNNTPKSIAAQRQSEVYNEGTSAYGTRELAFHIEKGDIAAEDFDAFVAAVKADPKSFSMDENFVALMDPNNINGAFLTTVVKAIPKVKGEALSVKNPELYSSIQEGGTFHGLISALRDDLPPEMQPVADKILGALSKEMRDLPIGVNIEGAHLSNMGAMGAYSTTSNTTGSVVIDASTTPKVLLHELVHAATLHNITRELFTWRNEYKGEEASRLDYVERLRKRLELSRTKDQNVRDIVSAFISLHDNIKDFEKFTDSVPFDIAYGYSNVTEFAAEFMSNKEFREHLHSLDMSMKTSPHESILVRMVNAIRRMFGLSPIGKEGLSLSGDAMFNHVENALVEVMGAPQKSMNVGRARARSEDADSRSYVPSDDFKRVRRKSIAAQSGDARSQMRTEFKILDLLYDEQIDAQNNLDSSDPAALEELKELDDQIKEFEKSISDKYFREYAQEITIAHKLVEKVFGIKVGELQLVRYNTRNKGDNNLGEVDVGDNDIGMGALRTWAETESYEMTTPAQVVFHEALHVLAHTSPSTIKAIYKAIDSQPKLKAKLEEHIKRRGYDPEDVTVELPSVLMEWLTTQPEFWDSLYNQNRTVFEQFVDFVANLIRETQDILKRKGAGDARMDWVLEVNADDLEGMTPEQLAEKMGIYFAEIKKGVRAKEQPAYVKPNSSTDINTAANKLDRDMATANKNGAERTVQKEKVRAQKVIQGSKRNPKESAKKAFDAVFGPRIQALLKSDPDPKFGLGPSYLEIIKSIREQVPNKAVADNLIDLAISIRDISLYQKKAEELLTIGYVTDPNYDLKDLIRDGVFKDLDNSDVAITEAELDKLVAGLEPAEAARIREESINHLKMTQEKVKAFQHIQQRTATLFKELMYVRHKIAKGEMTAAEATAQLKENIDVHTQSLIAREIADSKAMSQYDHLKGKSPKHILKYLKTVMDGRTRKGVATKDRSVEMKVLAQIQEDQGAISRALITNGLYDLFMGVSTMSADVKMNPEAQAVYGQKLKEASDMFWKDLMDAARNQEIPDDWKGIKALEDVYEAFIATNENLRNQLNELGAGIRYREGFTGLSQRWDERSILQHGEAQWRADMNESIDWEATEAAHGGVMNVVTDKDGRVTDWQEFDREAFLTEWHKEIKSNKIEDHASTDVVQSFGKHRAIVMKQASEVSMIQKYSGHKSLGLLYMDQIRHRSEMIAIAKKFGTRPIPNFRAVTTRLGLDPDVSFKDVTGLESASNTLSMKQLIATVEYLTGALDNPANKDLARHSKNFRKVSNLAFLPMSGVSAITDIPMIALTLQQSGVLKMDDMGPFLDAYAKAHARRFGGDEPTRQVLESMGAGIDASLNSASSRVALADSSDPDILGKLNDGMFVINYLNGMTTAGQEAFMDVMTRSLADQITAQEMDPLTIRMLEDFGFTAKDMKELVNSVVTGDDGVARVGPSTIKDPEVARKTRETLLQLMNEAVMFPDAGTQALVRGGLQAGTVAGEIARDVFQYSSFPLAMTRIITRKFMTNYQGTSPWTTHQTGRVQMIAFVGSMLALGYMSTIIKDLLRGREPMHLGNMSGKGWGRVVSASGVGGILEPMLSLGSGEVRGAVAPLPATLFSALMKETGAQKVDALRPLYGSAYPVIGPALGKTVGWAFGESVQELQNNRAAFLRTMYEDQ